ncbi:CDK-activating kinase assembly factor MAT1-like [Stegodyphus dumicola]|uniref:CDK-activating kinase assembly factor MAT1-like n=1 Tax=Stegodyphus dumicola TaxID=202533 RepID=UPI0015B29226|nr:CDK-activating kinase assembly factor MAT1-like [Stegodyphus dumicola]XP_035231477.1 CDK-activating kinase assembly factor MAT1-like [Stegodyphus dumicola]
MIIKMEDIECPRCKTTKYRNPNLKLMVNICGHALCENCVELLFVKGSAACPQCNIALRRNNFRVQIFEDSSVEKELDIRRRILKDFNKKEEDFKTLREYNDYLEDVETIIFNLSNNIDVDSTKRKIDQYKKENKTQIMKNKGKLSKEEEELEELLEYEKLESEARKMQVMEEELQLEKEKRKKKEALIDDLMFSDKSAKDIIASHSLKNKEPKFKNIPIRKNKFSTGVKSQQVFLPVPRESNENMYSYQEVKLNICGPDIFTPNTLKSEGFMQHVRGASETEMASGFLSEYACTRALHDAFCGIYFTSA